MIETSRGRVTIDGVDISQLGLKTLRSAIQMIPQDPVLFEGTFRTNLDPEGRFEDEALWNAIAIVGLDGYVRDQPGKLDAAVSQKGENLSVGQRQLMCLSRAILAKPKILIMDEATAAVDGEADQLIQTALKTRFDRTTVLSIAHWLQTIAGFDRVLVLDEGELVEFDQPHLLLSRPSAFARLADASGSSTADIIRRLAETHYHATLP